MSGEYNVDIPAAIKAKVTRFSDAVIKFTDESRKFNDPYDGKPYEDMEYARYCLEQTIKTHLDRASNGEIKLLPDADAPDKKLTAIKELSKVAFDNAARIDRAEQLVKMIQTELDQREDRAMMLVYFLLTAIGIAAAVALFNGVVNVGNFFGWW